MSVYYLSYKGFFVEVQAFYLMLKTKLGICIICYYHRYVQAITRYFCCRYHRKSCFYELSVIKK